MRGGRKNSDVTARSRAVRAIRDVLEQGEIERTGIGITPRIRLLPFARIVNGTSIRACTFGAQEREIGH